MATMNVVYPHFHDTQATRRTTTDTNTTTKDLDIENSVYHLLSLYLNADALELAAAAAAAQTNQQKKHTKSSSPYWKQQQPHKKANHRKSWLGEDLTTLMKEKKKSYQDLLLENNTIKNSGSIYIDDAMTTLPRTKKPRSKSVSFNETVIIISHGTSQPLVQQEEDVFVDASENFIFEEEEKED